MTERQRQEAIARGPLGLPYIYSYTFEVPGQPDFSCIAASVAEAARVLADERPGAKGRFVGACSYGVNRAYENAWALLMRAWR